MIRGGGNGQITTQLALAMVAASLAVPEDWDGNGSQFLQRTLDRWVGTFGGAEINRVFGLSLRLTRCPGPTCDTPPSDRLFLELWQEPGDHYGLELAPFIAKLEAVDRRFPSMFWQRFVSALRRTDIEVWDPLWALDAENDWWGDFIDEWADEEQTEGAANNHRPSLVVPASLKRGWVKDSTVRRALSQRGMRRESWAGELMFGALDLYQMARETIPNAKPRLGLTEEEASAAFEDCHEPSPSLVAMIREDDAIAHLIDHEGQRFQYGEPEAPCCIWPFEPTARDIAEVYAELEARFAVLRKAVSLIPYIEYPDGLPLSRVLVEVAA